MADNPEPNDDPVPPWLQAGYNPKEDDIWTSPSGVVHHASAKEASGLYAPSESNDFLANYNSTMTQDALSAVMERLRALQLAKRNVKVRTKP